MHTSAVAPCGDDACYRRSMLRRIGGVRIRPLAPIQVGMREIDPVVDHRDGYAGSAVRAVIASSDTDWGQEVGPLALARRRIDGG